MQIQPNFALAEGNLATLYIQTGRYIDATVLIRKGLRAEEQGDQSLQAIVNSRTGHELNARKLLNEMIDRCKTECGNTVYGIAKVYSAFGEKVEAARWFNIGYDRCIFNMLFIRVDPFFDALHGEPGYEELLTRMGLQS
jgi:hypothetical protein